MTKMNDIEFPAFIDWHLLFQETNLFKIVRWKFFTLPVIRMAGQWASPDDCVCTPLFSHAWLFATPWTVAPQSHGSSVHGLSQARKTEWIAISFSRGIFCGLPCCSVVKNPPANAETQEMQVQSLGREDVLEKERATHSSILAWEILWTEEPGGLCMESQSWTQLGTHTRTHTNSDTHTHTNIYEKVKWKC